MADWYIDHENTALYPSAYMATLFSPAQLPQDGDGAASGTGTAPSPASASWDLTSASASSGTMTIMGATVSGLNGSGATLAANIATAINASTASAAAVITGGIANVYLKAVVWAQASGATLNVYTRIASAALNYASNTACAMAAGSGWTSPPALAQFAGGVSGPWRYFVNTATLAAAVSGSFGGAASAYGGFGLTVMGTTVDDDTINVRTKRSGSNIECRLQTASTAAMASVRKGRYVFDDGSVWSGDDGVFKAIVASTHSAVYLEFHAINAVIDGNGKRLHVLFQDIASTYNGAQVCSSLGSASSVIRDVLFEMSENQSQTTVPWRAMPSSGRVRFEQCKFLVSKVNCYPTATQFGLSSNITSFVTMEVVDCEFVFTSLASQPTAKLFSFYRLNVASMLSMRNVRISDQNNAALRFPLLNFAVGALAGFNAAAIASLENVSGASVLPSDFTVGMVNLLAPTAAQSTVDNQTALVATDDGAFRQEWMHTYVDWVPGEGRPVLSSTLADGTAWSMRCLWNGQYLGGTYPPAVMRSDGVYLGSSGVKTITAELLFDPAIADADINRGNIVMTVAYTDSSGYARTQHTKLPRAAAMSTQLAAGSSSWANLTGAYAGWKPRKLEVTTAYAVKTNTNIYVEVAFVEACPTTTGGKNVFFDPEFVVA